MGGSRRGKDRRATAFARTASRVDRVTYGAAGDCGTTAALVYRDTAAHVTASDARTLSPYLIEAIEPALHTRAV